MFARLRKLKFFKAVEYWMAGLGVKGLMAPLICPSILTNILQFT